MGPNSSRLIQGKEEFLSFNSSVYPFYIFFFIFKPVSQNSRDKQMPPYTISLLSLSYMLESTRRRHADGLVFIRMHNVGPVCQVCLPKEILHLSRANFDMNWHCN